MGNHEKLECKKQLQAVITEKLKKETEALTIPEELNADIAALKGATDELNRLSVEFDEASAEEKSLFIQYSDANQQSTEYQALIETLNTQREYEAMQKQIAEAEALAKSLLVARNAKSEQVKALKEQIDEQTEVCNGLQTQVDSESSEVETRMATVNAAIAELDAKIAEIRGSVLSEEEFDKLYNVAKKKGGMGLVPVHGQVCRGCNTVLPVQFVIDLRYTQETTDQTGTCPYCSREIFYEEVSDEKNYMFDSSESTKNFSKTEDKRDDSEDIVDDDAVVEDDTFDDGMGSEGFDF